MDPRTPDAVGLLERLEEELVRRYDNAGDGNFKPDDVLVPRSGFLLVGEGFEDRTIARLARYATVRWFPDIQSIGREGV